MSELPAPETTVTNIFHAYERRENARPLRSHLGASMIGRECEREIWLAFRWTLFPSYEGRMLRLFERGKREEAEFIRALRDAGVTVHETDPQTKKQFTYSDHGGHFGGSMDAAGVGLVEAPKTWHVLEFKTHNAASFAALKKHGVAKAHPEHAAQMQLYMGWSGMTRAFYLAVNKDTDELHAERVAFDRKQFEKLRARAHRVIFSSEPPPHITDNAEDFRCRFCLFNRVCHGPAFPKMNCRTCIHSTPREDGTWHCARHDKTLTADEQRAGCDAHLFIPPMMAAPVHDAGDGFVRYETGAGLIANFVAGANVPDNTPAFSSRELEQITLEQLPAVIAAKRELGGTVSHVA